MPCLIPFFFRLRGLVLAAAHLLELITQTDVDSTGKLIIK